MPLPPPINPPQPAPSPAQRNDKHREKNAAGPIQHSKAGLEAWRWRARFLAVTYLLALAAVIVVALVCTSSNASPSSRLETTPSYHLDTDRDGIPDLFDFCPGIDNVGPHDSDGDLLRDECDLDPNNTGRLLVRKLPGFPHGPREKTLAVSSA